MQSKVVALQMTYHHYQVGFFAGFQHKLECNFRVASWEVEIGQSRIPALVNSHGAALVNLRGDVDMRNNKRKNRRENK